MRVTNSLIKNTVLRNVQRNLASMNRHQDMLSSGKTVTKPSDDPIKVTRIMGYNSALDQNKQYQQNIQSATSWLHTSEDAMDGMNSVLQRARELTVAAASETMSPQSRKAVAMEVDELINVFVQLGNSSYEGRSLFSGYKTTTTPFVRDDTGVTYLGDNGDITWEVAPSVTIKGNFNGNELFMDSKAFETMQNLVNALHDGDTAVISETLTFLSKSIDHILDKRAALGAIVNGLDLTQENFSAQKINFSNLRSQLEDIDFPETMINFSVMETIYRASISSGARIMQPSLLDFLR
jgi:flagellar hook-associated protein 3 FlgL